MIRVENISESFVLKLFRSRTEPPGNEAPEFEFDDTIESVALDKVPVPFDSTVSFFRVGNGLSVVRGLAVYHRDTFVSLVDFGTLNIANFLGVVLRIEIVAVAETEPHHAVIVNAIPFYSLAPNATMEFRGFERLLLRTILQSLRQAQQRDEGLQALSSRSRKSRVIIFPADDEPLSAAVDLVIERVGTLLEL